MKAIFSSRDLDAKLDRSRKFSVDIASEEKNECVGSVCAERRVVGFGVTRADIKAATRIMRYEDPKIQGR